MKFNEWKFMFGCVVMTPLSLTISCNNKTTQDDNKYNIENVYAKFKHKINVLSDIKKDKNNVLINEINNSAFVKEKYKKLLNLDIENLLNQDALYLYDFNLINLFIAELQKIWNGYLTRFDVFNKKHDINNRFIKPTLTEEYFEPSVKENDITWIFTKLFLDTLKKYHFITSDEYKKSNNKTDIYHEISLFNSYVSYLFAKYKEYYYGEIVNKQRNELISRNSLPLNKVYYKEIFKYYGYSPSIVKEQSMIENYYDGYHSNELMSQNYFMSSNLANKLSFIEIVNPLIYSFESTNDKQMLPFSKDEYKMFVMGSEFDNSYNNVTNLDSINGLNFYSNLSTNENKFIKKIYYDRVSESHYYDSIGADPEVWSKHYDTFDHIFWINFDGNIAKNDKQLIKRELIEKSHSEFDLFLNNEQEKEWEKYINQGDWNNSFVVEDIEKLLSYSEFKIEYTPLINAFSKYAESIMRPYYVNTKTIEENQKKRYTEWNINDDMKTNKIKEFIYYVNDFSELENNIKKQYKELLKKDNYKWITLNSNNINGFKEKHSKIQIKTQHFLQVPWTNELISFKIVDPDYKTKFYVYNDSRRENPDYYKTSR
ncbi:hypothetical protein [Mycoplasmopsis verecunda]|uniref:Lipoprotein n=1 Tax=Mycoplasmopsis verecunda TaxID=171291 RepID=A0A1T4LW85_9BACT|nr:hypothetical protein [Mycoplasmopsis verecunda]WPB54574.1 hypothetical protein SAM46_00170 [Mycoplasmopsis verecunda]SJZ58945.1 hypothetical protein SAMN02745154_00558 [Mycoplasmopsis verecunda]